MSDTNKQEKDVKLKIAGMSYILGDAAMMAAGRLRKEPHVFRGGATWMLGGIGAAIFGNPDQEMQLKILSNRLERHLKDKGIEIPNTAREQSKLLKQGNFWDRTMEFLFEHPSEILNGAYAIGASMLVHGELNKGAKNLSANFWMGAVILTGAVCGLLLKEKPESEKKTDNGNPLAFITSKPLLVSGAAYMTGNVFLAGKVYRDIKNADSLYAASRLKPHYFSGTQLASYLFANTMLMMSPRNQVKQDFSLEDIQKLQEAAALVISAQPKDIQDMLVKDMSEFMSKQAGITLSPEQLQSKLHAQLKAVANTTPVERRFTTRLALREAAEQTSQHSL